MRNKKLIKESFGINITVMKLLGLYPYDFCPKIYRVYAYIFYILFTIPTSVLATIHLIVERNQDMKAISESLYIISQLGVLWVKLLPFKNHPERTRRTIAWLNEDIFNNFLPEQEHIIQDVVRVCRQIYILFLSFCMTTLITWPMKVFFFEERRFPINIWLPFNAFEDTTVYASVFVFIVLGVANAALGNAALDTLIAGLIHHAAGQLRILKDSLTNLGQRVEEQVSKESGNICEREQLRSRITYRRVCECIDHYDAIFEFVKDLEKTYSFAVFTQFMGSIVVICISCLQLSVVEPFTVIFFSMIMYLTTVLTEVYLYCYHGSILYEESNTIITAIYMSQWYTYDEKSKKALITLMERAKRPMVITAGKILDLSLETFTLIIRKSYSLLAVLKNY